MGRITFARLRSESRPAPGDAGKTGAWRIMRPVIDVARCTPAKSGRMSCFSCWLFCPDGVISRAIPPTIDYEYCKGCGICAEECPASAIRMIDEGGNEGEGG